MPQVACLLPDRSSVTARHLVTRVAIFGEAMDFAAHALHVAMHEQMAQEPGVHQKHLVT